MGRVGREVPKRKSWEEKYMVSMYPKRNKTSLGFLLSVITVTFHSCWLCVFAIYLYAQ